MYCVKCGVKLGDTEQHCPLCGTRAYHPDLERAAGEPLYSDVHGDEHHHFNSRAAHIIVTTAFVLPAILVLLINFHVNHTISWAGFVSGGLLLAYLIAVLPTWFKKPNPVIFVPCDFAAITLFLLYINVVTEGDWFLSFAFPIAAGLGLIVTVITALLYYIGKGKLFIFGGTFILLGILMPVFELLSKITFHLEQFIGWCIYPTVVLLCIGGMLIFLAINSHAREAMEKRFFI